MKTQVKKDHYDFDKYVDQPRRNSYYQQINEVAKCKWKTVLLIWVWDWIVADCIKKIGKDVTTFDFDKALNPDIIWDVTKIDEIITRNYDIVVCCQVLEHIPFEIFEETVERIHKIANNCILSLPNKNIWIKNRSFCPIFRNIIRKFHFRIFWQNNWELNKDWGWEHFREIDAKPEWKLKNIEMILDKFYKHRKRLFHLRIHITYFLFYKKTKNTFIQNKEHGPA